jgi:hypothetical protein
MFAVAMSRGRELVMISWFKRLAAPVAAVALLASLAGTANANTVSYTTSLKFTSSGTNVLDTGAYSLTFNGATINSLSLTMGGVVPLGTAVATTFGTFSTNADSFEPFIGAAFTFSVFQSDPATVDNNPANLLGDVTGFVTFDDVAQVTKLHFTSTPSFMIGDGAGFPSSVHYSINQDQTLSMASPDIRGFAAAAPLPGVALAGMALLGGLGGLKRLRRRTAVTA